MGTLEDFTLDEEAYVELLRKLISVSEKVQNAPSLGKSLHDAITDVLGETKPFSISGSLPLVRDLQRAGLDLTITGFGQSSVYHGDNEFCQLSDMKNSFKILGRTISNVEAANTA